MFKNYNQHSLAVLLFNSVVLLNSVAFVLNFIIVPGIFSIASPIIFLTSILAVALNILRLLLKVFMWIRFDYPLYYKPKNYLTSSILNLNLVIFIVFLIIDVIPSVFPRAISLTQKESINGSLVVITIFLLVVAVLFVLFFSRQHSQNKQTQDQIRKFKEEDEIYHNWQQGYTGIPKRSKITNNARLASNELKEYYIINQSQVKTIFNLSVLAISIGLVAIIALIVLHSFKDDLNTQVSVITGIASLFSAFIGGALFIYWTKASDQMKYYSNQLYEIRKFEMAEDLVNTINDEPTRHELIKQMMNGIFEKKQDSKK